MEEKASKEGRIREVGSQELKILTAHLARSEEIASKGSVYLRDTDFSRSSEISHLLVWRCCGRFLASYGKLPQTDELYGLLSGEFASDPSAYEDPAVRDAIYRFAYDLYFVPLNPAYAMDILQLFVYQRRFRSDVLRWAESGGSDPRSFKRKLDGLNLEISKACPLFPFVDDYRGNGKDGRTPIGVSFVDDLTGGGTMPGDTIGFIAPSGCGKTTLVNQIGVEMARMGRTFVIFHYEQSLESGKPFFAGLYACASGVRRDRFLSAGLTEEETDKHKKAMAALGGRLAFFDMSGVRKNGSSPGSGGVKEIASILVDLDRGGKKIDGFAVDWFLPMATRSYALSDGRRDERKFYQGLVDELKRLAEERSAFCWINHQLAPSSAGKRSKTEWHEAAEFKSFAWLMDICFTVTSLDENGQGIFNASKNRNSARGLRYVKLDGPYARFSAVDDRLEWSSGLGRYIPSGGAVPFGESALE